MVCPLAIGIDVGTSGIRALAIDRQGTICAQASRTMPSTPLIQDQQEQSPGLWWDTLIETLSALSRSIPVGHSPQTLALDGTSGTLLLADHAGDPLGQALMYSDQRASAESKIILETAPGNSGAHGPSSALSKLLWLLKNRPPPPGFMILHQADWLLMQLGAPPRISDENNVLKLGYDPVSRRWPDWLNTLEVPFDALPKAVIPGMPVGRINPALAHKLGWPTHLSLVAGTTDSVAAFIATGANQPGEAMTSLGSTLVLKLLSSQPVFYAEAGIYSHRVGNLWLVGGASNSGGAVLRAYFSDEEIEACTPALRPDKPTGLDYYPLLGTGERFPISDPTLEPKLTPRPDKRCLFFQGMLEGMANIERLGYQRLAAITGESIKNVRSTGGGAQNPGWTRIRADYLGVPIIKPDHHSAAYGAALLAQQSL